jgi:hypothetical protein
LTTQAEPIQCAAMSSQRPAPDAGPRRRGAIARRVWGPDAPLRRALRWLVADRERIAQEGLLAERTLLVRRRSAVEEQDAPAPESADRRDGGEQH